MVQRYSIILGKCAMVVTHDAGNMTKGAGQEHTLDGSRPNLSHQHDGRPQTLGPSHDHAVASSFAGLWKL